MFFKKYFLSPLFLLIFVVSFSFSKSVEWISVLKKCPAYIAFFFLVFWRYKHINYFIWSLPFVSSKPAHFSYFTWLISCPKFFEVLISFDGFVCFNIFWNIFKKYIYFFCLVSSYFVVKFSFSEDCWINFCS